MYTMLIFRYLDAVSDAKRAVKLDPLYLKAWARLGKIEHASVRVTNSYSCPLMLTSRL
jgi:hypothetical protein